MTTEGIATRSAKEAAAIATEPETSARRSVVTTSGAPVGAPRPVRRQAKAVALSLLAPDDRAAARERALRLWTRAWAACQTAPQLQASAGELRLAAGRLRADAEQARRTSAVLRGGLAMESERRAIERRLRQ